MRLKDSRLTFLLLLVLGIALSGCTKQKKYDRFMAAGDKAIATGDYEAADIQYRSALAVMPEDGKALGRLGIMAYDQGRLTAALIFLKRSIEIGAEDVQVQVAFGRASNLLGRTAEARAIARKVLEKDPANEGALLLLVDTSVTTRDNNESRRLIEELQAKDAGKAAFDVALGSLLIARRDLPAAEAKLRKALELEPKSASAHAYIGLLHVLNKDVPKARESLKMASDLSPLRSPRRTRYIEFLSEFGAKDEAKREAKSLVAKAPDFIPAVMIDMRFAMEEARYDDVIASADKVLKLDRTSHDVLLMRAGAKLAQKDYAGGISTLKEMERFYDSSPLVKFHLGNAHWLRDEVREAEEAFRAAIRLSPTYDDAILGLARLRLHRGSASDAISLLTMLLRREPKSTRAHVLLARAYQAKGDLEESLAIIRKFSAAAPESAEGALLGATVLAQLRRIPEARAAATEAVRLQQDLWPAWELLVSLDLLEKKTPAAKERVEALTAKFPRQPEPWLLRAKVHLQEEKLEAAEADLLKGIDLGPNEQQAYLILANLYVRSKKSPQAVETLTKLAATNNKPSSYMRLGVLHDALRRHDAARAAYEKALALDARFVPALNNLAVLFSEQLDDVNKAYTFATQARELAPQDARVADTLGWILFRKGEYERALTNLRTAVDRLPSEPEAQYHLGMTLYYLGQEIPARQAFQVVLSAPEDSPLKRDAQARLAVLALDVTKADAATRADLERRAGENAKDPVLLARLGALQQAAGDTDKAIATYEAVLQLTPKIAPVMVSLVELYAASGTKPARAKELAQSAAALTTTDGRLSWRLGRALYAAGDHVKALSLLDTAARDLPNEPLLTLDLARALFNVGRIADAEAHLTALSVPKTPADTRQNATELLTLAKAVREPEQATAALPLANKILAANPKDIPATFVSGLAMEQKGDFAGARVRYEQVLAQNPAFAPAARQLALIFVEHLGDDVKAEEMAAKASAGFPNDAVLSYILGSVTYRKGDYTAAVRHLRQAIRQQENHPMTTFLLGMALFQSKNAPESRTFLIRSLELNLPAQEAAEARRVLQEINRGQML